MVNLEPESSSPVSETSPLSKGGSVSARFRRHSVVSLEPEPNSPVTDNNLSGRRGSVSARFRRHSVEPESNASISENSPLSKRGSVSARFRRHSVVDLLSELGVMRRPHTSGNLEPERSGMMRAESNDALKTPTKTHRKLQSIADPKTFAGLIDDDHGPHKGPSNIVAADMHMHGTARTGRNRRFSLSETIRPHMYLKTFRKPQSRIDEDLRGGSNSAGKTRGMNKNGTKMGDLRADKYPGDGEEYPGGVKSSPFVIRADMWPQCVALPLGDAYKAKCGTGEWVRCHFTLYEGTLTWTAAGAESVPRLVCIYICMCMYVCMSLYMCVCIWGFC